jgi:Skp family chaperone for outer membrane proteins
MLKNKGAEIMSRYLGSILAAAFAAAFAVAFLCVSVSSAQEAKFGFVDMQEFTQKSTKFQGQQQKLMNLFNMKKSALEAKAKELQTLKDSAQMLNDAARNEKIKEMTMKETELKFAEQEAKTLLQNEEQGMMQALQTDMKKIIAKVRQERKLVLVFNSAALLSADDALDLTKEVASAYDADASVPSKTMSGPPANPATTKPKPAASGPGPKPKPAGAK